MPNKTTTYRQPILALVLLAVLFCVHNLFSDAHPFYNRFGKISVWVGVILLSLSLANWLVRYFIGHIENRTSRLFALVFLWIVISSGFEVVLLYSSTNNFYFNLDDLTVIAFFFCRPVWVALIFAIFALLYHFFSKITGRRLNNQVSQWHFWLTTIGTVLLSAHIQLGVLQPRRYYSFKGHDDHFSYFAYYNELTLMLLVLIGLTQLILLVNLIISIVNGRK